jgi:hypothetical protein
MHYEELLDSIENRMRMSTRERHGWLLLANQRRAGRGVRWADGGVPRRRAPAPDSKIKTSVTDAVTQRPATDQSTGAI